MRGRGGNDDEEGAGGTAGENLFGLPRVAMADLVSRMEMECDGWVIFTGPWLAGRGTPVPRCFPA